ncbi:MAG: PQQ-binding-like beta-propeller repeat protein, partial [Phycisphaerales bacterium]|nr:PQQ-binding-like beta-propeller repeat protein [Phycisphaerales bacterium]
MPRTIAISSLLLLAATAAAEDWPMAQKDIRRSGATAEHLDAPRLMETWRWTAAQPPAPAWPSPARWDAYATLAGMKSMRNYDPVQVPVVAGEAVFLASNADDTLRCLDLDSGELSWQYTAGGPIRIAPSVAEGRVYFGADDGVAYCLDAETGKEAWRFDAAPAPDRFLNNGRAISFWPIRTGVLVDAGTAYFGSGMFPWNEAHLFALDAGDGSLEYTRDLGSGLTLEGAMLASRDHLLIPQGRIAPRLFDRSDGSHAGSLKGGGGSFVVLLEDGTALHGPGNKKPSITESRADAEEALATFDGGNAVVVHEQAAYLLTDHALTAINRVQGGLRWSTPLTANLALVLAGETLYVGGRDEVLAVDADKGRILWKAGVDGRAYGLAVANGRLLVSTDRGTVHCFEEGDRAAPPPRIDVPARAQVEYLATAPSPPVPTARGSRLMDRWIFQSNLVDRVQTDPNDPRLTPQVRNLVANRRPAVIAGQGKMIELDATNPQTEEALRLDGTSTDACVAESIKGLDLPSRAFTAMAWVRIDEPTNWGGIIGVAQDNGAYEKGFMLGYRDNRFGMAVNGTDGPDKLTWMIAPRPCIPRGWHHVAGSYDGEIMKLYVDGKLVSENREQSGDIQYPTDAFFQIAAYRDEDEYFRLKGAINEVQLHGDALSERTIAAHAKQKQRRFPPPPAVKPTEPTTTIAAGPIVEVLSPERARVRWWT